MTPVPTKVALGIVLAVTAGALIAAIAAARGPVTSAETAPILCLLTGLFALRVAGQILVALRAPSWLPAMGEWNLMPYRFLLPSQLIILAVMGWIDVSLTLDAGAPTEKSVGLGWTLIALSAIYAAAMGLRYAVRMLRRPSARWFGGTIPIVFHLVLATYLYALGSFHADR